MTTVNDSFTGTLSTSNWYNVPTGATPVFSTASDQLKCDSGAPCAMRWMANTFSGDQYAQIKVKAFPSTNWGHGPMVKLVDAQDTGYIVSFNGTRAFVERGKASANLVIDAPGITVAVDDLLRLTAEASGANLLVKLWKSSNSGSSWTQLGSTYTDTSPYNGTRIGIGSYAGDASARVDDWEGGDYVASSGTTINTNLGTATASGFAASIAAATVISCALGTADASGYQSTIQVGSNTTITASLGTATASGFSAAVAVSGTGTLVTEPLKNNTGTLLASQTGATAFIYNVSTGALVVAKTGQTTDGSGVMTITDALISPATQYRVVVVLSGGAEGMARYTAS